VRTHQRTPYTTLWSVSIGQSKQEWHTTSRNACGCKEDARPVESQVVLTKDREESTWIVWLLADPA